MTAGLRKAIDFFGNQNRMAIELEISRQSVSLWVKGRARVSPEHVQAIVKLTGGAIKPHELRPDIYPRGTVLGKL